MTDRISSIHIINTPERRCVDIGVHRGYQNHVSPFEEKILQWIDRLVSMLGSEAQKKIQATADLEYLYLQLGEFACQVNFTPPMRVVKDQSTIPHITQVITSEDMDMLADQCLNMEQHPEMTGGEIDFYSSEIL